MRSFPFLSGRPLPSFQLPVLAILLLLGGCLTDGDFFYLRSNGADLPIWVQGATQSGNLVVVIHGGPGGSAFPLSQLPAFDALEEQFGVVYWDQRGAGTSQGNASSESLTFEQYREDAGLVVDLVREKYDLDRVFLLGHSWGGALALSTAAAMPDRFQALILVDPAYNTVEGFRLSREWVMQKAQSFINAGEDVDQWERALAFYGTVPVIHQENLLSHYAWTRAAGGFIAHPGTDTGTSASLLFGSPFSLFSAVYNGLHTLNNFDVTQLELEDQLKTLTLPTLIAWGEKDGILPVDLAEPALSALGTDDAYKKLVLFPESAHSPFVEEGDAFAAEILAFLEASLDPSQ